MTLEDLHVLVIDVDRVGGHDGVGKKAHRIEILDHRLISGEIVDALPDQVRFVGKLRQVDEDGDAFTLREFLRLEQPLG